MLYINVKVNGHDIQAFVDSGAQSTIISYSMAEKIGILKFMDKRFAGMAVGVGTSKILGRVHAANMEILGKTFVCSFTVLEDNKVDLLFGLDNLKRHQCCIDLV
jgi:DNA damage-inducible protein 1